MQGLKLLREDLENSVQLVEGKGKGKDLFIEGIFAQSEIENRNKRIYPKSIMEKAIGVYNRDYVKEGRGWGELEHPESPRINPDNIAMRITELKWSGNDVIGKAIITNTPKGLIAKGLIESGGKIGVSTRALGTLTKRDGKTYVNEDLQFNAVDIVLDPSAPSAFVNGIMEGVEYFYEGSNLVVKKVEEIKKRIHKTPSRHLAEAQIKEFEEFMSFLRES